VQFMVLAGKARAALQGRYHVSTEDVRATAHAVLRHRMVTNYSAEAEGFTADRVIDRLLETIQPHHSAISGDERLQKILTP